MKAPDISETPIVIRPAKSTDLADINAIYNHYIAHSSCVWETQPCSEGERKAWYEEHGQTLPVLVAESDGHIIGWGALGSFRAAYTAAGTLEDSIYVHHNFHRRKIGSQLLAALIEAARRMGLRSILANIRQTRRRASDCTKSLDFSRWHICEMLARNSISDLMQCIYSCSWQPNTALEPIPIKGIGTCSGPMTAH